MWTVLNLIWFDLKLILFDLILFDSNLFWFKLKYKSQKLCNTIWADTQHGCHSLKTTFSESNSSKLFTPTFKRTAMMIIGIKRNRSCLINQVVHRIHWLSPIIFMVSRIRVSFSRTSSFKRCEELKWRNDRKYSKCKWRLHSCKPHLDKVASWIQERQYHKKWKNKFRSRQKTILKEARVRKLLQVDQTWWQAVPTSLTCPHMQDAEHPTKCLYSPWLQHPFQPRFLSSIRWWPCPSRSPVGESPPAGKNWKEMDGNCPASVANATGNKINGTALKKAILTSTCALTIR